MILPSSTIYLIISHFQLIHIDSDQSEMFDVAKSTTGVFWVLDDPTYVALRFVYLRFKHVRMRLQTKCCLTILHINRLVVEWLHNERCMQHGLIITKYTDGVK